MRGNDVAFAAHAAVLSTVVWSMFWPALWGFEQEPRRQGTTCGIGRGVWGIWGGCLAGVGVTAVVVGVNGGGGGGGGGGDDGKGWAWIDVVSGKKVESPFLFLVFWKKIKNPPFLFWQRIARGVEWVENKKGEKRLFVF